MKAKRARPEKARPAQQIAHDDEPEHRLTGLVTLVGRHSLAAIQAAARLYGATARLNGELKTLEASLDELEGLAVAARDAYLGDPAAAERLHDGLHRASHGADGAAAGAAPAAAPALDVPPSAYDVAAVVDLLAGASQLARGERAQAAELARCVRAIVAAAVARVDPLHGAAEDDLKGAGAGRLVRALTGGTSPRLSASAAGFLRAVDALVALWQELDPVTAWWQASDDSQDNARIGSLSVATVRAGTALTLRAAKGARFDARRPPGVGVFVGRPALEARVRRWSPQAVEVVVPTGATSGPVFFARELSRREEADVDERIARIGESVGSAWRRTFLAQHPGLRPAAGWVHADGRNVVEVVWPPRIVSFTATDTDGARVGGVGRGARPARGPRLTLAWQVVSHDPKGLRLRLTRDGKLLHGGLPAEGTLEVDTRRRQKFGLRAADFHGIADLDNVVIGFFGIRIVPGVVLARQDQTTPVTVETTLVDPDSAVRVELTSSAPERVIVSPSAVTIPAGQRTASAAVRAVAVNHRPGEPAAVLTGRAEGYDDAHAAVWVENDRGEWRMADAGLDLVPVHVGLFSNGKLLFVSWDEDHPTDMHKARYQMWDPATEQPLPAGTLTENVFCSGHCFLPDGRLLVIAGREKGGHIYAGGYWLALGPDNDVFTVDLDSGPTGAVWTQHHDMREARWYPTCVTLPDGRALLMGGTVNGADGAQNNLTYELFDWVQNRQSDRRSFGRNVEVYPFACVLPEEERSGKLFAFQKDRAWLRDVASGEWLDETFHLRGEGGRTYPKQGGFALLPIRPSGNWHLRLLIAGGIHHDQGLGTAEVFEFNTLHPEASFFRVVGARLNHPRYMCDTVLLPDGNVLVVNGAARATGDPEAPHSEQGVLYPELFDSHFETFREMAPASRPRQYHSVAALLPDGRVLVAGNTKQYNPGNPIADMSVELFSPPYLFRGPRPTIDWAPGGVFYDDTFPVHTIFPGDERPRGIERVALLRASSSTHSNNMDQRYVLLQIVRTDPFSLTVRAPRDASFAPPGYYMLFLINRYGVPSVGRFVRVGTS